ncbi:LexA-binding, inner membrane-associated putative hydrolase [Modestobacter sp. DSM 44400]|uniref:metal-dependent hydrolase n=1 Tax=Modestobacter sp. DSM 44400 TaxID=1550230 RepID=UPI000898F5ED|nr:metal-dependent hydrolase [Modestobacter sp. DSM 44400]SDX46665.1 LexA-binding, inner membrane-associated putative hydrolase [Modestobacter sp. DSM 44400]
MLGHSHALSGLAAGAATLPWVPVHGTVAQVAWVSAVGGFAMLPDLDQQGATISRMWGPVTDLPAGLVGRISGGHRWGTHDAVLAPAVFGLLASVAAGAYWSSLLLLALAIGLALRALNFVIPGRAENTVVGNLLMSLGGAWLLLEHSPSPQWLPLAVMAGVLAHIAGDALTCQGVPVPLVWILHRARLAATPMRTGAKLEKLVFVPPFSTLTLTFLYLNTGAREALSPLVQLLATGR